MIVTGEAVLTSLKSGTSKKNGNNYYSAKFLDSDAEEFVTFFIDINLYRELEALPKNTPVVLTLNLALASKFFSLEAVETA